MSARRSAARAALAVVLALAATGSACRRGGPHQHPPLPSGEAEEGGPAFQPATAIVDQTAPASTQPATVVAARTSTHADFDRLVVELTGTVPGYRVAWLLRPPRRCASGEPTAVPGTVWLEVRLDPAQAHDTGGQMTLQERATQPRLPAIDALAVTCDFEGVVSIALGAAAPHPYRVLRLLDPPRLVVDVAHGPAGAP